MANVLARLRGMVDDAGTAVWTNDQMQDVLDQRKLEVYGELLEYERTPIGSGTYVYTRYRSRWGDLEEATSGTAYFRIFDSAGSQRGTAAYTADYLRGVFDFAADQMGTELYLIAWSYDLNGAAADLWRQRAGKVASYYDVKADGHSLSRSQWRKACIEQADAYAQQSRPVTVRQWTHGVFEHE
jgi:hypothetical protein